MCYNDNVDKCKEDSKGFSFCKNIKMHEKILKNHKINIDTRVRKYLEY